MSRPSTTKIENIMSVADAVVWAFLRSQSTGTRPKNENNVKAVCDTIGWIWGEE